jgi:hypothetical protein
LQPAHNGRYPADWRAEMKTPKLLPWYARKAGISEERAAVLWRKAVREATAETGWVGNAEYWGAAMDVFQRLLAEEKDSFCAPRVTPLVRSQNRMLRLPLIAMEDMFCALSANWQRNLDLFRKAA